MTTIYRLVRKAKDYPFAEALCILHQDELNKIYSTENRAVVEEVKTLLTGWYGDDHTYTIVIEENL